jgi:hypothetical protein
MKIALAFLYSFIGLELEVIQPSTEGRAKGYNTRVSVTEFGCFMGSIKRELLVPTVLNDNLAASVSAFIPLKATLI